MTKLRKTAVIPMSCLYNEVKMTAVRSSVEQEIRQWKPLATLYSNIEIGLLEIWIGFDFTLVTKAGSFIVDIISMIYWMKALIWQWLRKPSHSLLFLVLQFRSYTSRVSKFTGSRKGSALRFWDSGKLRCMEGSDRRCSFEGYRGASFVILHRCKTRKARKVQITCLPPLRDLWRFTVTFDV